MSNFEDDFKKRFTNSWFSANWSEIEVKGQVQESQVARKDLAILEAELEDLKNRMEDISQKQLILANLATLYN